MPQLYTDQVPRRSTHKPLNYRRDGQTDRQTDGQTAFQLYIVDMSVLVCVYVCMQIKEPDE